VKKEAGTVGITLDAAGVQYKPETKPELIDIDNFGESFLDAIKKRIEKDKKFRYDSEKAYQFNLARNPFHAIIDTEFKYEGKGESQRHDVRIDLVRIDKSVNKLIFIEVKTQDDTLDSQSIAGQLERYHNFIKDFKGELVGYYKKILEIKTSLGLLKGNELSLDDYTV
jgi:stress response protein SCP2